MTTLSSFSTTEEWQELTGISDIAGNFTIQNKGYEMIEVYMGDTPNSDDSFNLFSEYSNKDKSEARVENISNTDKVWVRSSKVSRIAINKD